MNWLAARRQNPLMTAEHHGKPGKIARKNTRRDRRKEQVRTPAAAYGKSGGGHATLEARFMAVAIAETCPKSALAPIGILHASGSVSSLPGTVLLLISTE